jgi:DNA-3-methyladenine glycosylase I
MAKEKTRCPWPGADEKMIHYHDHEWGTPQHNDQKLFEAVVSRCLPGGAELENRFAQTRKLPQGV